MILYLGSVGERKQVTGSMSIDDQAHDEIPKVLAQVTVPGCPEPSAILCQSPIGEFFMISILMLSPHQDDHSAAGVLILNFFLAAANL